MRRRVARIADGARRRLGVFRPGPRSGVRVRSAAEDDPEKKAADRRQQRPAEQPGRPRSPRCRPRRHRSLPRRSRCAFATARPAPPSAAMASRAATRPMFPVTRSCGGGGSSAQPRLAHGGTGETPRSTARHDDHGGHPLDVEQPEQARVDGDTGLRPAEALADALRRLRQSTRADAAQHQRYAGPGRLARPLPPARGRDGEAGEDQHFRRAVASGRTSGKCACMAFGREGSGLPRSTGDGLPCRFARPLQGAVQYRACPVAEIVVAGLAQDVRREIAARWLPAAGFPAPIPGGSTPQG